MPILHPREQQVREAEQKLAAAISDAVRDLTTSEQLQVVNLVASNFIARIAKYAIRHERHGNTDIPGGWAG